MYSFYVSEQVNYINLVKSYEMSLTSSCEGTGTGGCAVRVSVIPIVLPRCMRPISEMQKESIRAKLLSLHPAQYNLVCFFQRLHNPATLNTVKKIIIITGIITNNCVLPLNECVLRFSL